MSLPRAGNGHVNLRPHAYVSEQLALRGFEEDQSATQMLRDSAYVGWMKSNLMVFRRRMPILDGQ